jgi:hypothetical protein
MSSAISGDTILATTQHEDQDGSENGIVLACVSKRRKTDTYSKLTVGSSSSSRSGSMNRARARAILMRHPPENSLVRLRCISGVKLRPWKDLDHLKCRM